MKVTVNRMDSWRTSCLPGFVMIFGLIAVAAISAQESKPAADQAVHSQDSLTSKRRTPDQQEAGTAASQPASPLVQTVVTKERVDFRQAIVRVTELDAKTRQPLANHSEFSGVRFGPGDGLIVTLMTGTEDEELKKKFKVQFADRSEHETEILDRATELRLTVLNVPGDRGSPSVSLAKIRKAKKGDTVVAVPSSPSTPVLTGHVTEVNVSPGAGFPKNLIQTDISLPPSERGGLLVSDQGEPIGIWCAAQEENRKVSFAIPLEEITHLIDGSRFTAAAAEAPADSAVDSKVPDISGTWRFKGEATGRTEGGQPVTVTPQTFDIRRVYEATADYVIMSNADEKGSKTKAKWSAETERFEAETIYKDPNKGPNKFSLRLLNDGQSMEGVIHVDPNKKKQLLDEGWTEEKIEAATKLDLVRIPDISGKWQTVVLGSRKTMEIRRSFDGTADFVIEWQGAPPKTPIKWLPEDRRFHGTFPTPKDNDGKEGGSIALTPSADASILHVKMSIEAQDMKEFEKKHGTLGAAFTQLLIGTAIDQLATQEWVKIPGKRHARTGPQSQDAQPDISGRWQVGKNGPIREIRQRDKDGDFSLLGQFRSSTSGDVRLKWIANGRYFDGTTLSEDSKRSFIIKLVPTEEGKKLDVIYSFDEASMAELRRTMPELKWVGREEWTRIETEFHPPTGTVANPEDFAVKTEEDAETKVFSLANASATECLRLLKELFPKSKILADHRTNSVIAVGDKEQLSIIEAVILRLDETSTKPITKTTNSNNGSLTANIAADSKVTAITGTWTRADGGTFSKLNVWPVQNRDTMFFVECPEGNGLFEWLPERSQYVGYFTFDAVGVRTAQMYVAFDRSKDTNRLTIVPFEDQRKQLLRSGFAKTDRELDTKLSSEWNRAEAPAQPMATMTIAVVKTQLEPHRVRDSVRSRVPYRVFSNDTFKSVIVIAPADAQDEIEALIHQLDVDEPDKSRTSLNAMPATPANDESGSGRKAPAERTPLGLPSPPELPREKPAQLRQLNSPEGRKLSESINECDARAQQLADDIRENLKTLGPKHPKQVEARRQLEKTLDKAIDLKFKLEQLQIDALAERLAGLKKQIVQRQAISQKIVARRADDLIRGDLLRWDSKGAEESTPANATNERSGPRSTSAEREGMDAPPQTPTNIQRETSPAGNNPYVRSGVTSISFSGPPEKEFSLSGEKMTRLGDTPVTNFKRHPFKTQSFDLHVQSSSQTPQVFIQGRLDIAPEDKRVAEYLDSHDDVNLRISDEDTRTAWNELLTRVIYLPKEVEGEDPPNEIVVLDSAEIESGVDPVKHASQEGTVVAVLHLARDLGNFGIPTAAEMYRAASGETPASTTGEASTRELTDAMGKMRRAQRDASRSSSNIPTENEQSTGSTKFDMNVPPSYLEFAKKLAAADSCVEEAEEKLKLAESEVGKDVVVNTVPNARRNLEAAIRNRKALQDEHTTILRDLELQIESAQIDVDGAKMHFDRNTQLGKKQIVTQQEVDQSELQLKRSSVVLERLKLQHDRVKKAGEATVTVGDPSKAQFPSPEELKAKLDPFTKRVLATEKRVRELESQYYADRSNAAVLQKAFDEMTQARVDWWVQVKAIASHLDVLNADVENAELLHEACRQKSILIRGRAVNGEATEEGLKTVADSLKKATDSLAAAKARMESYGKIYAAMNQFHDDFDGLPLRVSLSPAEVSRPEYDAVTALAWLEIVTDLKLEFVQFEDLKLSFKAALRVREAGHGRKAGDLIVTVNGREFSSIEQAVENMRLPPANNSRDIVLDGGLAGYRKIASYSGEHWAKFLKPSVGDDVQGAKIDVEIRTKGIMENEILTVYVQGVCVSIDGLVVIPVSAKAIAEGEPIVAYKPIKGTARIVASDAEHRLTLLKFDSSEPKLTRWLKCRPGRPSLGQKVLIHGPSQIAHGLVTDVNRPYANSRVDDGFLVSIPSSVHPSPGTMITTVDDELQGIVLQEKVSRPDDNSNYSMAIPAVHIEKLIKGYRNSLVKGVGSDQHSLVLPPGGFVRESTLDETLQSLIDSRDVKMTASILNLLLNKDVGDGAGRVATAVLAAMEFYDPLSSPVEGQSEVFFLANEILKKRVARSIRVPVIVKVLNEGHPRSKMFAIGSLDDNQPLWEYANEPEFPALAELLLAMAAETNMGLRVTALNFLGTTLSISKIDLTELTTEERRKSVRLFSEAFPHEKVENLLSDALGEKDIDLVLRACYFLCSMPDKLKETELSVRLAGVLTQIIEGKFHDVDATMSQRGCALRYLEQLRERSAPAVPVLIKLLRAGGLEEGEFRGESAQGANDFTRRNVIRTLGQIGPSAKDALPILEEELSNLEKKEREDALLSGQQTVSRPRSFDNSNISVLKFAIGTIKNGLTPKYLPAPKLPMPMKNKAEIPVQRASF